MEHFTLNADLCLQLWRESDAEEAFTLVQQNRTHLARWIQWAELVQSAADLQGHIRYALSERQAGYSWQYAVRQHGVAIGGVGLVRRSPFHLELGYWLSASHTRQGIMTRCCEALAAFAFDTLSASWIEICCAAGNERSQAVARRLGFVHEEQHPQANWTSEGQQDTLVYRLYSKELDALRQPELRPSPVLPVAESQPPELPA